MQKQKRMQTRITTTLSLAALAIALSACGGGKAGNGAGSGQVPDPVGTVESPQNVQSREPAAEQPAEQPPQQQEGTPAPASEKVVQIGFQTVVNTPVETVAPHPGHEPLPTQVQSGTPPAPQASFSKEWFVSPSGNDSADGSQNAPFKTLAKGVSAVGPGEVLRVLAGEYNEPLMMAGKDGRADAKITIQGEGKPKITGNSGSTMVDFTAKYWVVDGFDIDAGGKKQFAVTFHGNDEGSILANCEVHHGTHNAGVNVYGNSNGVTIENNNIHDFRVPDDDSHAVVVQPTTHNTTIRNNDIHDASGDDVQCLGPEGYSNDPPADGLTIENNHLYKLPEEGLGENATDIKTCSNVVIRNNRMQGFRPAPANQGAKGDAIIIHMSAKNVLVEGNDVSDSGKGVGLGGNRVGPMPSGVIIRRNTFHDIHAGNGMEGSGMRIANSDAAVVENNTFWNIEGMAFALGDGTNGPTQNLTLKNNIVGAHVAMHNGSQLPGLQADGNMYLPGAVFQTQEGEKSLAQWQAAGQDKASIEGQPTFTNGFTPNEVAVDKGQNVGLSFCGGAPDIGAVETAC